MMLFAKESKISNYQKELDKILQTLQTLEPLQAEAPSANPSTNPSTKKPTLLLHACCGPCSSYVLEYLFSYFDITVFYYNPNIFPPEEYNRRLLELKNFYTKFAPAQKVKVVECTYDPEDFYTAVGTRIQPELAQEPEKGERCRRCYEFRLKKSFDYAAQHNFDYFCTTLSISPFKDAQKLNVIGNDLHTKAGQNSPKWLPSDFKKKNGFKRSLQLSAEYGLYRQDYCGCVYSMNH